MRKATLNLFNAIQVRDKNPKLTDYAATIPYGFVLDYCIDTRDVDIDEIAFITGEQLNSTFFKSWQMIKETSQEELFVHQILHYFTVYGFEALNIFDKSTVYIPYGELDIPTLNIGIPLKVIKGATKEEILEGIITLGAGIALSEETIADIMIIVKHNLYDTAFIAKIKNRELKVKLNKFYNIVPKEPVEFLRFWIEEITGSTLLIKNAQLITLIEDSEASILDALIPQAPKNLSSIFLRYKPLFLAMRRISNNKAFFNKLRRDAKTTHKPLPENYLSTVTHRINTNTFNHEKLVTALEHATIFQKIRLLDALTTRFMLDTESVVYKVRNGRDWATTRKTNLETRKHASNVCILVYLSIISSVEDNFKGKVFYIPEFVEYTLPATEKQFTGNFPFGSYIQAPESMVFGVHWTDLIDNRIDLDLAVLTNEGKVGWNTTHKANGFIYSGDNTSAPLPNGATEAFFTDKLGDTLPSLVSLNYYNYMKDAPVPFTLFVAHKNQGTLDSKFMVDPNNVLMSTPLEIACKEQFLGLVQDNKFYFAQSITSSKNVSGDSPESVITRDFYTKSLSQKRLLRDLIIHAGGRVVTQQTTGCINLAPEALDKTSIISLLM